MDELQPATAPFAVVTSEADDRVEFHVLADPTAEERSAGLRQLMSGKPGSPPERIAATLPREFGARVHIPEVPAEITVTARFDGHRVSCHRLTLTAGEVPVVDGDLLRRVPVAQVLRLAATAALGLSGESWSDLFHFDQVDTTHGPTDEVLAAVAAVYAVAFAVGDRPTKAVGQALQVPRTTATGWVAAARRRGFLGGTEPRRQGVGS